MDIGSLDYNFLSFKNKKYATSLSFQNPPSKCILSPKGFLHDRVPNGFKLQTATTIANVILQF